MCPQPERSGVRLARRGRGLAADPEHALLVVYPAHVLDQILAHRFAEGADA
ncbi:hypothetical protein [Nocardia asiatica]|uniref:hypothetical protein n=1 Tax=Nocardia asiatica TaxID=209252 RepID=UPI003EE2D9BF